MPPITTGEFVDEEWDGFSLKEKISRGLVKVCINTCGYPRLK